MGAAGVGGEEMAATVMGVLPVSCLASAWKRRTVHGGVPEPPSPRRAVMLPLPARGCPYEGVIPPP